MGFGRLFLRSSIEVVCKKISSFLLIGYIVIKKVTDEMKRYSGLFLKCFSKNKKIKKWVFR